MGSDGFDQISIAVLDDNNIHVAWNGMVGLGGRYHRWSSNGGQTWSETIETIRAGLGGTEGFPQIAGDQSGTLHMLTTYEGCAWYTYLQNQRWANPVCISGEKAQASNYIEEPAMAVSEGNKLHAVFWDERKRLWYTTRTTEAPWIPPQIAPTNDLVEAVQTPTPIGPAAPTLTPVTLGVPTGPQLGSPPKFSLNPGQVLILSVLPVILLIGVVVVLLHSRKIR
jgi:hypothetical protein